MYGLYELRQNRQSYDAIIVTEGYLDVLALVQHGIPNVVATLGTAITKQHIQLLFQVAKEVIFCFDGDAAGQKAAWRGMEQALPFLTEGRRIKFLSLPEKTDPDDYVRQHGQQAFLTLVHNAHTLDNFMFSKLVTGQDLGSLENKADIADKALVLFELLPDGMLKKMLYERLSQILGVDKDLLTKKTNTVSTRSKVYHAPPPKSRTYPSIKADQWAVVLLLKDRTLLNVIDDINLFEQLTSKSAKLFCELVSILKKQPTIDLQSIEEMLSPASRKELVSCNISGITHIASEPELLRQEFLDVMSQLRQQVQDKAVEALLLKAKTKSLAPEEKRQLKELLKNREIQT